MDQLDIRPIPVEDNISPEDFQEKYLKPQKPVVLRNFTKGWAAMEKWTYSHLKELAGQHKVKLYGKWLDNEPTRIEMPPVKEVPFAEYIEMLEKDEESDLRIFLFNLFKLCPELLEDFSFPNFSDNFLEDFPYMFFGAAGSDVRLHYDIDLSHVFITQFGGTKRITLFEQSESKYLYKLPFTTHSAVDMSNIDYEKYPAVKYAKGYQTDLKPGETLFMPSGIWHYIQYLDGSFSLSLRALADSSIDKLKGAYNVFVVRKLDEYLNKYYGNKWSDYKLKKAMERATEILEDREEARINNS
ncbi:cupin-like domain-containing protein [Phaeocystidibacter luteus]|uniref:Cupin-like domain-containing protein n=1 Tax=Phaeocystidibacter luteus TaxID=911197 RepID=A0A6N6RCN0_9FLAO|nr:cupin-like domain-containing protein [Phaeocystidibacter luteus]KAB2805385.1 cupin-like domain-containing protein [Phaeocystidibacter luteus]